MPQDAYPIEADVASFFTDQGITAPTGLDKYLAAAIARFEKETGYKPFLGAAEETTVLFDAPAWDGVLDLRGGFWDISAITTSNYPGLTARTIDLDTEVQLLPLEADGTELGYNEIRFLVRVVELPGSVRITGKRGYAEKLPDDAWQAIIEGAAAMAFLKTVGTGAVKREEIGTHKVEYDLTTAWNNKHESWSDTFDGTIARYRRVVG